MEKIDEILKEEFGEAIFDLPLNYRKAKSPFNNENDENRPEVLKFVCVNKLSSKKTLVQPFYRNSSRYIVFN